MRSRRLAISRISIKSTYHQRRTAAGNSASKRLVHEKAEAAGGAVTRRSPGSPARTTARGVNARSERESFRSGSIVTRTSKCKECGGSRLCPHQRERSRFKGAVPVNEVDTRGHR